MRVDSVAYRIKGGEGAELMQIGEQLIITESLIPFVCDKSRRSIQLIYQLSPVEQNSKRQTCRLTFSGSSINRSIWQEFRFVETPTPLVKQIYV